MFLLCFRDARERDVAERVHKHTLELREKRRQAGLIPHPSAELLEAENQLAKVRVHLLSCSSACGLYILLSSPSLSPFVSSLR